MEWIDILCWYVLLDTFKKIEVTAVFLRPISCQWSPSEHLLVQSQQQKHQKNV